MNRIWKLRRQGVLLMTLGLGMILGNVNSKIPLAIIIILYIVWLLIYDYAMEAKGQQKSDLAGKQ